jgi:hypothetical protein
MNTTLKNYQHGKQLFVGTEFVPTVTPNGRQNSLAYISSGYLSHDADLTLTVLNNTREQFSYNNLLLLLWDKSELQCAKMVISILYIFKSVITTILLHNYNQQMKLVVDFVMQQQHF